MRAVLKVAAFRRLLAGWTVGNFADSVLYLALAVWAKGLTGSSSAAGLVFMVLAAPVLLAPVIGLIADRVSRKRLLVAGHAIAAAVTLTLVLVREPRDVWIIYVVTFVYGTLGYVNGSAQGGLVRDMLPTDLLGSANSMLVTIDQGLRILTPSIGAALYVFWGGQALALAVAGMLLVAAIMLSFVRVAESPAAAAAGAAEGGWSQITAGLRHLRSIPLLVRMVLTSAVAFGVVGFFDTALFELIEKGLGRTEAFFGVLMSIQGAGSVIGGLTAAAVLARLGPARAQGAGLAMVGLAGASMLLWLAGLPLLPVIVAGCFTAGVGIPWMVVALITTRQRCTPPRLQGRVGAAMNVAMTVPQIASIGTGAALVLIVDYRVLMIVAGAVLLSCAVSLWMANLPQPPDVSGDPAPELEPGDGLSAQTSAQAVPAPGLVATPER